MFRCAVCQTEHRTLRDILTCHPAELRAVMDTVVADNLGFTVPPILDGIVPVWVMRRAFARIDGTSGEEASDAMGR